MSVYVHPLIACIPTRNWRWSESTHMVADSLDELHAFAAKIGLRREWFQDKRLQHYDLNPARFVKAIDAGAQLISLREFSERFIRPTRLKKTGGVA